MAHSPRPTAYGKNLRTVGRRPSVRGASMRFGFCLSPFAFRHYSPMGPIAQWLERPAHNRLVPGSNPGGPILVNSEKDERRKTKNKRRKTENETRNTKGKTPLRNAS